MADDTEYDFDVPIPPIKRPGGAGRNRGEMHTRIEAMPEGASTYFALPQDKHGDELAFHRYAVLVSVSVRRVKKNNPGKEFTTRRFREGPDGPGVRVWRVK